MIVLNLTAMHTSFNWQNISKENKWRLQFHIKTNLQKRKEKKKPCKRIMPSKHVEYLKETKKQIAGRQQAVVSYPSITVSGVDALPDEGTGEDSLSCSVTPSPVTASVERAGVSGKSVADTIVLSFSSSSIISRTDNSVRVESRSAWIWDKTSSMDRLPLSGGEEFLWVSETANITMWLTKQSTVGFSYVKHLKFRAEFHSGKERRQLEIIIVRV